MLSTMRAREPELSESAALDLPWQGRDPLLPLDRTPFSYPIRPSAAELQKFYATPQALYKM
jgi:hypothetical protein